MLYSGTDPESYITEWTLVYEHKKLLLLRLLLERLLLEMLNCVVAIRSPSGVANLLLFFINLQPLKKWSTTNYAPFALDREPGSLTDILRPRRC